MDDRELKAHVFSIVNEHYRNDFHLFWQRTNFFLLLEVGLLGFYFSDFLVKSASPLSRFILEMTGFGLSIAWLLTAWSSLRWIDVWRKKVVEIDRDLNPYESFSAGEAVDKRNWRFHLRLRPEVIATFMPVALALLWLFIGLVRE